MYKYIQIEFYLYTYVCIKNIYIHIPKKVFEDPGVLRASSKTRLISFCCLRNRLEQIQSY